MKYTQAEMPDYIDVSRTTWGNWENNVSVPDLSKLIDIAKLFGVTLDKLLLVDLSENVHLNENVQAQNKGENVHLNVHPNVHLKQKKAQKEPCKDCEVKDQFISIKEELLQSKAQTIAAQDAQIKLLQNQIDTMKFDMQEREKTQYTQEKERKTA